MHVGERISHLIMYFRCDKDNFYIDELTKILNELLYTSMMTKQVLKL